MPRPARLALECGGVLGVMAILVGVPVALFGGWGAIGTAALLIAILAKTGRRS